MTITFLILNLVLALIAIGSVGGMILLAHRLPTSAPHSDKSWGIDGDPWVPSDPLPLRQLADHEVDVGLERAA